MIFEMGIEQVKSSGFDHIMAWMRMPTTCDSTALSLMRMGNTKLMQLCMLFNLSLIHI